ncbi:Protein RADIALIS-like 6 [Hibiscus syriacus]|uniref:Protein RADIALIS-like 6 n=1 Tax=Hibiscus syriacus TaxID=106335 RepID=A0A6A3A1T7_HIBSY|nr:Protein RADIALIS-like 6 [Hibiscus syriacus]
MDKFPDVLCGWSWEENKLFELALAVVDERHPDRWEVVAAMVGGKKTAEDVHKHYVILLEDLQFIESGKLDHELAERKPCIQVDCTQSVCWTDDDNKYTPFFLSCLLLLHRFLYFHFQVGFRIHASGKVVDPKN